MERPYRTWGYPLTPIVFLSLSMFVALTLVYLAPGTAGIGYLLALTGIPVYFIWRKRALAKQKSAGEPVVAAAVQE
jgi:APA family basic amino acid/polyamine antiporter